MGEICINGSIEGFAVGTAMLGRSKTASCSLRMARNSSRSNYQCIEVVLTREHPAFPRLLLEQVPLLKKLATAQRSSKLEAQRERQQY